MVKVLNATLAVLCCVNHDDPRFMFSTIHNPGTATGPNMSLTTKENGAYSIRVSQPACSAEPASATTNECLYEIIKM